jgi:hypothetical protein
MKTFTNLPDSYFTESRWCFQAQTLLGENDFKSSKCFHESVFESESVSTETIEKK